MEIKNHFFLFFPRLQYIYIKKKKKLIDWYFQAEVIESGRRARRSAAAAASVAMTYLTETEDQVDSVFFGTRKMAALPPVSFPKLRIFLKLNCGFL